MARRCVLFTAMSCGTGGARRTTKGTTEDDDRGIVIRVVAVPAPGTGERVAADARRRVPEVADTARLRGPRRVHRSEVGSVELDAEIEEFQGPADVIHVAVSYPARASVANLAKRLR
jgi:hypothetical protein